MQLMPETGHGFAETSGLARRLSFRRAHRQRMLQHESRLNRKQLPTDLSRKANPSQPAVASPPADHPNSRKRNVQKTLLHYIENTGDTDLVFLGMFKADRFEYLSFWEWLAPSRNWSWRICTSTKRPSIRYQKRRR